MNLLAGNEKQANARKLIGLVSELVGTKGKVEITPSSLYSDKQKVLQITADNGKLFSFVCEYKLSQLLHNKVISLTDLGAMEICQVALMGDGPDKGKLVNKVLLPESWKETIVINANQLKKVAEVQAKSLFMADQLASW